MKGATQRTFIKRIVRLVRRKIINRLVGFPALQFSVRVWFSSSWFRFACFGLVATVLTVGLSLPKVWNVAPKGLEREIRISVLDWLQARALLRSAEKELLAGKTDQALVGYQMALANNPGDLLILRRFLKAGERFPLSPSTSAILLQYSVWLQELSPGNMEDLELAVHVLDRLEAGAVSLEILGKNPGMVTTSTLLARFYLKALFDQRLIGQFIAEWGRLGGTARFAPDKVLILYYRAYTAGWGGKQVDSTSPDVALSNAFDDPVLGTVALRLALAVHEHQRNVEKYWEALQRLEQTGAARLGEHVRGWVLLAGQGKKAKAVSIAEAYRASPRDLPEVFMLVRTYQLLGMNKTLRSALPKWLEQFPPVEELWMGYISMLVDEANWSPLQELALRLRTDKAFPSRFRGMSFYAEGRAFVGEKRSEQALRAFEEVAAAGIHAQSVAIEISRELVRLGFAKVASSILKEQRAREVKTYELFEAMNSAALASEDSALLLESTQAALALRPQDLRAQINYTAALCFARISPEEAVARTFDLSLRNPDLSSVKLNRAAALNLSGRWDDSVNILEAASNSPLSPQEWDALHFSAFEAFVNLKRWPKAREHRKLVNLSRLSPEQLRELGHLDLVMRKDPSVSGAK